MNAGALSNSTEGSDLRSILAPFRRHIALIVLCFVLVTASAFVFSSLQEKQYSATASLLFRDPGFDERVFGAPSFVGTADPAREAATNVHLVSLDVVADQTADALDRPLTGTDVSNAVEVEAEGQSDVVSVTATDTDPRFAATLANTFVEQYILFRRQADRAKVAESRELVEQDLARLSLTERTGQEGETLQDQISALKTLEALQTGNAELVQRADVPRSSSSPKVLRNTVFGAVVGLFLGLGLALLRQRLDRRLRDSDELGASFDFPVLGTVPDSTILGGHHDAGTRDLPFAEGEAFRMLRTKLRYFNVDRNVRSVLVSSPGPGEGKSTVAWNLACTAAEAGTSTLLLEADLHQPTVAARHNLAPLPGLSELLTHQVSRQSATQYVPVASRTNGTDAERKLAVITAGSTPPNPVELMESEEMARLIDELMSEYELVIVDTPPVSVLADAIPVMKLVTGVIVVGQLGRTTRDDAIHLRDQLRNLDAPVLGVVANRARKRGREYGYGYGYGRGA